MITTLSDIGGQSDSPMGSTSSGMITWLIAIGTSATVIVTPPPPVVVPPTAAIVLPAPPAAPLPTPPAPIPVPLIVHPPSAPPTPSGGVPQPAGYATRRVLTGLVRLELPSLRVQAFGTVSGGLRPAVAVAMPVAVIAPVRGQVRLRSPTLLVAAHGHTSRSVSGRARLTRRQDDDERLALELLGWSDNT